MYRGKYIPLNDFSGGYCGYVYPTQLKPNQALDCNDVVILPQGGFRQINGNAPASTDTNGQISGMAFYVDGSSNEYIVVVDKTGLEYRTRTSTTLNGITYAGTIGDQWINTWDLFPFNNNLIGFGNFNAPWTWTGSGNATALGGTPPSAYGAFTANNRVFAFNTTSTPSTIYWSVLGNAADWTGAGSGSAVIGSLNENDPIISVKLLGTNTAIIFKKNSIHLMSLTAAPFSSYTLFKNVGCLNKDTAVPVDGKVYFINQNTRMQATDGESIEDFPATADNLWNQINSNGLRSYVRGFRQKGRDYDWIVWTQTQSEPLVGSGLTDGAIIWDLINKCWLFSRRGYANANVMTIDNFSQTDTHNYFVSGFHGIMKLDDSTSTAHYYDPSNSLAINPTWRSGWLKFDSEDKIVQIRSLILNTVALSSATLRIDSGYEFISDSATQTISLTPVSTETNKTTRIDLTGRGNYFQFNLFYNSTVSGFKMSGLTLKGKEYGQKRFQVT